MSVADFHAPDVLNFTHFAPNGATATHLDEKQSVHAEGTLAAAIAPPGLEQGSTFSVESDNAGGSLVALAN